jgi:hypothetical protein
MLLAINISLLEVRPALEPGDVIMAGRKFNVRDMQNLPGMTGVPPAQNR